MLKKPKTESQIQTEIIKYLKGKGYFCFRVNNGAIHDANMNQGYGGYRAHVGMKGVPDIIMIANDGSGKFIGIECKTPTGKLSADQILFERRCKRKGAIYIVATSVDDLITKKL